MVFLTSDITSNVIMRATSSFRIPRTMGHFVAVLGGSPFACRIACLWAAGGYDVHLYDPSLTRRAAAVEHCAATLSLSKGSADRGTVYSLGSVALAVEHAWLVIETGPEDLGMKKATFKEVQKWASRNAILCSTSGGFTSSEIGRGLKFETRRRMLNMHFDNMPGTWVALRADGEADKTIFPFLADRLFEIGMEPFVTPWQPISRLSRLSRSWAATKRKIFG